MLQVIGKVTESLRPRQTLLFSATLPNNLERLARSAVLDPVRPVSQYVALACPAVPHVSCCEDRNGFAMHQGGTVQQGNAIYCEHPPISLVDINLLSSKLQLQKS